MNRNRFREIFMYGIMNNCLGPGSHSIQSFGLRDILNQMDRLVMKSRRQEEMLTDDESDFVKKFNERIDSQTQLDFATMTVKLPDCAPLDGRGEIGTCRIENPLNIISWMAEYFCNQISENVADRRPTFSETVLMEMLGSIEIAAKNFGEETVIMNMLDSLDEFSAANK